MQKKFLFPLLVCAGIFTAGNAQVGVGTLTPHSTLDVRGSVSAAYRGFTTSTAASLADNLLVFTGTAAATLTLPDATTCAGRTYWIKSTSTSPLTVATIAAQTIDGQANWILATTNQTIKLVSNGAGWLVAAETSPGNPTAWVPGGNNLGSPQNLGTTSNTDLPFITNNTEKMRLLASGRLEVGNTTTGIGTAIVTRADQSPNTVFDPATYANYNGGVIQSTYPGSTTGQNLNIAATGANSGNWPSNIVFFTRNNGGTNSTEKMRLFNSGRLEVGTNTTSAGPAILTRSATSPNNSFNPANYSDYNGGVIQSTYPGSTTGQNLNIAATGANAGNWPSNIVFFTRNNGGTNATEKMRLFNSGRLEVGTNTTSAGPAILTRSATSPNNSFNPANYSDYNGGVIQSTYPGGVTGQVLNISATGANAGNWPSSIAFWTRANGGTNAAQRMWIDDNGNVGIGCSSPNYKLQVVGDIAASGGTLRAASAVISTSISACSDIRYKKNIAPITHALGNIMLLQGVSYNWKTAEFPDNYFTDKNQLGVIAQELEKVYPELVETDAKGYKTVDYSKMAPVLIEAIKEQQQLIEAQQAQINSMKNDIELIKKTIAGAKK